MNVFWEYICIETKIREAKETTKRIRNTATDLEFNESPYPSANNLKVPSGFNQRDVPFFPSGGLRLDTWVYPITKPRPVGASKLIKFLFNSVR